MHAESTHAIKKDHKARPGMLFRCLCPAHGWHADNFGAYFPVENCIYRWM
jgi:hypothetical protein